MEGLALPVDLGGMEGLALPAGLGGIEGLALPAAREGMEGLALPPGWAAPLLEELAADWLLLRTGAAGVEAVAPDGLPLPFPEVASVAWLRPLLTMGAGVGVGLGVGVGVGLLSVADPLLAV